MSQPRHKLDAFMSDVPEAFSAIQERFHSKYPYKYIPVFRSDYGIDMVYSNACTRFIFEYAEHIIHLSVFAELKSDEKYKIIVSVMVMSLGFDMKYTAANFKVKLPMQKKKCRKFKNKLLNAYKVGIQTAVQRTRLNLYESDSFDPDIQHELGEFNQDDLNELIVQLIPSAVDYYGDLIIVEEPYEEGRIERFKQFIQGNYSPESSE